MNFLKFSKDQPLDNLIAGDLGNLLHKTSLEVADTAKFVKKFGETQHDDLKDICDNISWINSELSIAFEESSALQTKSLAKLKEVKRCRTAYFEFVKKIEASLKEGKGDEHTETMNAATYEAAVKERELLYYSFYHQLKLWKDLSQKVSRPNLIIKATNTWSIWN